MWIVSQNGTIISNTDTMQGITVDGGVIEIWHDGKVHNILGCYSSQDKVANVRDEILQAVKGLLVCANVEPNKDFTDSINDFTRQVTCISGVDAKIEPFGGTTVFQMPEDGE